MAQKVISRKNLPANLPIWSTLTTGLALDHWNAPSWLWGVMGTLFVIIWIVSLYTTWTQESVEMLK